MYVYLETLLRATMGIPEDQQMAGILTHASFAILALVSWYLAKDEQPKEQGQSQASQHLTSAGA